MHPKPGFGIFSVRNPKWSFASSMSILLLCPCLVNVPNLDDLAQAAPLRPCTMLRQARLRQAGGKCDYTETRTTWRGSCRRSQKIEDAAPRLVQARQTEGALPRLQGARHRRQWPLSAQQTEGAVPRLQGARHRRQWPLSAQQTEDAVPRLQGREVAEEPRSATEEAAEAETGSISGGCGVHGSRCGRS